MAQTMTAKGQARKAMLVVTGFFLRVAYGVSTSSGFGQALANLMRGPMRGALQRNDMQCLHGNIRVAAEELELSFGYLQECYSQEGEDLVLNRLFQDRPKGFYVDVGAHHPIRFSNTYLLYRKGWRGINIDAMPGAMEAFARKRPGDINLECMVSTHALPRTLFQFDEPALNTASPEIVEMRRNESPQYRLISQVMLVPRSLAEIFEEHLPKDMSIDMMTVDVEGLDLDVLQSNDWSRFRPEVIVVEVLETDFTAAEVSPVQKFLAEQGYRLFAKLYNSAIFKRS